MVSDSKSFDYLIAEEDLYTVKDLKERYKWKKATNKNRPAVILIESEDD
jgi:hypothetical protein